MDEKELESAIEGILFASGEPIHIERICFALSIERGDAERALRRLQDYYAFERRGMRLLRMEDRWQLCSSPDHADAIRKAFEIRKPAKLSQPALEALTIIAYYQPTTRAYVDKLRGVDSAYTVGLLLERGLIETCGNLQAPGRPLLYRTTEKFLRSFHISSLNELPPLNEDDIPPQQLKIEDMRTVEKLDKPEGVAEVETVETPETVPEANAPENVPEANAPEIVPQPESVDEPEPPEAVAEPDTPEVVPQPESVDEPEPPEAVAEPNAPEVVPQPESVDEPEQPETVPEPEAMPEPESADETTRPPRELMAVSYPRLLAPRPEPVRRRAAARTPYRMAGTFRTPRKRPGRKRRKSRRIVRPRRATAPQAPLVANPPEASRDTSAPEASPETNAPEASRAAPRRKLSSKTVRRCFHCLLCGCWLSWPFCSL
ncbi:MAG: SMC-Scp complex subunit ScpB [Oscillibacter sp.]|nr:SMC-Scp complex subunit ScpB [Oscillibacter sp.]